MYLILLKVKPIFTSSALTSENDIVRFSKGLFSPWICGVHMWICMSTCRSEVKLMWSYTYNCLM